MIRSGTSLTDAYWAMNKHLSIVIYIFIIHLYSQTSSIPPILPSLIYCPFTYLFNEQLLITHYVSDIESEMMKTKGTWPSSSRETDLGSVAEEEKRRVIYTTMYQMSLIREHTIIGICRGSASQIKWYLKSG